MCFMTNEGFYTSLPAGETKIEVEWAKKYPIVEKGFVPKFDPTSNLIITYRRPQPQPKPIQPTPQTTLQSHIDRLRSVLFR